MKLLSFGGTHKGLKREHNEDAFCIASDIHLYMVADGIGGHAAGEIASKSAVELIQDFVKRWTIEAETWPFGMKEGVTPAENIIANAIRLANREIYNLARRNIDYHGMGTTIAALFIKENSAAVAHIGDSRVYRIRNDNIRQLTADHTWVNEQVKKRAISKSDARNHRWGNVITRAMGNKLDVEVDVQRQALEVGDVFLLCSDGLSGMVDENRMFEIISENKTNFEKASKLLISEANENGGTDNITVVLVEVEELS